MTDDDLIEALAAKMAQAEKNMLDQLQKDLFSDVGISNSTLEAIPWKWHEKLRFNIRHSKLVQRLCALWNVLWTGECKACDLDEEY